MLFKKRFIFNLLSLLFLVLISLNIFANNNLLEINQIDNSDAAGNTFYLSKNTDLSIGFNSIVNFNKQDIETYKNPRIELSYEVFGSKNNNVDLDLSDSIIYFENAFSNNFYIYISTNNYFDKNTKLKFQIDLYDEYDNLLDTDRIYLNLKYNNSPIYFSNTKDHSKPKFVGYNYSRDFFILNSVNDKDVIDITLKSTSDDYYFSLSCDTDENLSLNQIVDSSYNTTSLIVSVDNNKTLTKDLYVISCYAQDGFEKNKLKDITLRFIPISKNIDLNLSVESETNVDSNLSKISALFSFNKGKFNFKYLLVGILIIFVLLLFIKPQK